MRLVCGVGVVRKTEKGKGEVRGERGGAEEHEFPLQVWLSHPGRLRGAGSLTHWAGSVQRALVAQDPRPWRRRVSTA